MIESYTNRIKLLQEANSLHCNNEIIECLQEAHEYALDFIDADFKNHSKTLKERAKLCKHPERLRLVNLDREYEFYIKSLFSFQLIPEPFPPFKTDWSQSIYRKIRRNLGIKKTPCKLPLIANGLLKRFFKQQFMLRNTLYLTSLRVTALFIAVQSLYKMKDPILTFTEALPVQNKYLFPEKLRLMESEFLNVILDKPKLNFGNRKTLLIKTLALYRENDPLPDAIADEIGVNLELAHDLAVTHLTNGTEKQKLFSFQFFPEPYIQLNTFWKSFFFKVLLYRFYEPLQREGLTFAVNKDVIYRRSRQLLYKFWKKNLDLMDPLYFSALRLTALSLTIKSLSEQEFTTYDFLSCFPIRFDGDLEYKMCLKLNKMEAFFLEGVDYNLDLTKRVKKKKRK